jgi:predicted  nucleic acid-binding Zn-ribbon protein
MATTTQEHSISDQLVALIRLQHIDSKIDQIKQLRGDLPDEIKDMEDEKEGLTTRLDNLKQELKDSGVSKIQAVTDVKDAEQLIKKYEEQQLQVRNNREYDALTKEIEAQKQRIIDNTTLGEEIDLQQPVRDAAVEEAGTRLKELNKELKEKKGELQEVLEDTKSEQAGLEKTRKKAQKKVDERYVRAYDRLRSRVRDGRAVVPLERGAAAGFAVPPQRQLEIRQRNRIVACEHTGRIIVDGALFQEAVKGVKA